MPTISDLSSAADLSQAIYSNLEVGAIRFQWLLDKATDPNKPNRSEAQARDIAERYEVVKVFSDTNTGGNSRSRRRGRPAHQRSLAQLASSSPPMAP